MEASAEDRFIEGAREHGEATVEGDAPATNKAYRKLALALREIREQPDRGDAFLASLLSNQDLSVVAWASTFLLFSRQREASEALQRVSKSASPLIAFGAEMTLKEWKAGRLKVD